MILKCYLCYVRYRNFYILLYCTLISAIGYTQSQYERDSTRALKCFKLFQKYEYADTLLARQYSDSSLYYAYEAGSNDLMGRAHQFKGWYFQDCSRFKDANTQFFTSLSYLRKAGSRQGVADAYGNLGNSYLDMYEYRKSLKYQQLSLTENDKIIQDNPDEEALEWAKLGRTYALHNIANIFQDLELYEKALQYEYRSVAYELEGDDSVGVAISYNTLAAIHKAMDRGDSAIYYFNKALDIYKGNPYPIGLATSLHAYATMEEADLSMAKKQEMLREALEIFRDRGALDSEMKLLIDVGEEQFDELTIDSLSRLLEVVYKSIKENDFDFLEARYFHLYSRYNSRIGRYDSAYFALENFLELKAVSDEKKHAHDLVAQDIRYELENSFAMERLKHQEDINAKQNYIYLSVIGLLIVLVSLFYFVQSNRRGKRVNTMLSDKNELIQEQKDIVEEKNRSISDSINYAKRLQTAILPTTDFVNNYIPDSFLMFKPKDIVSGDFHWFEVREDSLFIAAADCTGHGVPGAMVSVVCSNALNQCVNEFGLRKPGEILDKARELVIERFAKSDDHVADGMDISLCAVQRDFKKLTFAGANNPLWILRKNDSIPELTEKHITVGENASLIEIKGDKQPVGEYAKMTAFTTVEVELLPGDTIYLLTDGFPDQFGGELGKKFKYRPLKQLVVEIGELPLTEQRDLLQKTFDDWKGDLEQVDDVCVIGFKPT